ncbi:unnamed protein product [Closterium sp. NIES-64]|nr:unnamed protein product [Closterium sp. NIES-64]
MPLRSAITAPFVSAFRPCALLILPRAFSPVIPAPMAAHIPAPVPTARGADLWATSATVFTRSRTDRRSQSSSKSVPRESSLRPLASRLSSSLTHRATYAISSPAQQFPLATATPARTNLRDAQKQSRGARGLRCAGRADAHASGEAGAGAARGGESSAWQVELVPCLSDNYAYLLRNAATGAALVVDPAEAAPVEARLAEGGAGGKLAAVLCTHHHWDHTGGNLTLKDKYGATVGGPLWPSASDCAPSHITSPHTRCSPPIISHPIIPHPLLFTTTPACPSLPQVVGPAADRDRIPGIDVALSDGDTWQFEGLEMHVLHTPGHTRGTTVPPGEGERVGGMLSRERHCREPGSHCALYFPALAALFTGDTLFSLGCGRLFEGTPSQVPSALPCAACRMYLASSPQLTPSLPIPEQMWASLSRLASLPAQHQVEPNNAALQQRVHEITRLRSQSLPTIPSTVGGEAATNPFLRAASTDIRQSLHMSSDAADVDVFAALRRMKDNF